MCFTIKEFQKLRKHEVLLGTHLHPQSVEHNLSSGSEALVPGHICTQYAISSSNDCAGRKGTTSSWSECPHGQLCAVCLLSHTLGPPAEVHSGDLALSANGMADEKMLLRLQGVQEPMSVVQRPQPVYFNSIKINLIVAANERMQASARGRALCNSLPSLLPAMYSKPKSALTTSTGEDADSLA